MTEHFEKAPVLGMMEEQKVDDKKAYDRKADEKVDDKKADEKVDGKNQTEPPKVDPAPQNDNDMSLVKEAEERGLRGTGTSSETDAGKDMDRQYLDDAYKVIEVAQKERDSVPKAEGTYPDRPEEPVEERAEHERNIQRLAQRYREENNEDMTAALERIGVKEGLDVPNYRQHVTDERMQGWGRALARFGSVGLKQGADAVDTAARALGEFRKLTRAFLSPDPMSVPSQMLASSMVGMGEMYDMMDRAGQAIGIRQGADRSIAMETAKGAQYYKDRDRAVRAANFIMQSFNDQIRDTLGPQGDVTQLNPAQYRRIMEKMGESLMPEIERIRREHASGRPPTMEDRAIMEGWKYLNTEHRNAIGRGKDRIRDYRSAVTAERGAVTGLNREYNNRLKAYNDQVKAVDKERKDYDRLISGIDSKEQKELKALGDTYIRERRKLDAATEDDIEWQKGYDESKARNDSIGTLLRITLGKNLRGSLRGGDAVLHTLQRAQDEANSNSVNVRYSAEQQNTWRKIAEHFGRQVQTVRNMSAEQRRQYASKLASTADVVNRAPKSRGRAPGADDDPYGFLDATKKQRKAIVNMTPKQYSDRKIAEWKKNHVLGTDQSTDKRHRDLYKGAVNIVGKMAQLERKAYLNPLMTPEERADVLKRMGAYRNKLTEFEGILWDKDELEVNDVFDESYKDVYNGMGRDEYRMTLPKREREFPKAKGRSKSAIEYNALIEDYESRKDDLDMLRYDFLNGEFKDWTDRRNAIFRGRHLNRLLDDQRDRISVMYDVLSKAGRIPSEPPLGHNESSEGETTIDTEAYKPGEIIDAAQGPADEGRIKPGENAGTENPETDDIDEQTVVRNGTEQKNNEDETVGTEVQEEPSINVTEHGDVINTISEDLKTLDKEGLERRIADLKGLDRDDPQVADLLRMAQDRLNAEPVVETEVSESNNTEYTNGTEPENVIDAVSEDLRTGEDVNLNSDKGSDDKQDKKAEMSLAANKILKNIVKKILSGGDLDEERKDVESLKTQFEMYDREYGITGELERLRDAIERMERLTSGEVDIQKENRKNLEEARTTGPNVPELRNTIVNTPIDLSQIKTLSKDSRKADSNKLLSELPEDAAPVLSEEDRNKRESVINETKNSGFEARAKLNARKFEFNKDNRIGWKYPGEKIRGLLGKSENGLDDIEKKVGNIKSTTPDYEKREKVKKILWNAAKDLKFIKEYFGNPTDLNKTAINKLKTSMDTAYRYLYAHDLDKELTSDETVSNITKMKEELEQKPTRNDSDESKIKEYNDFINITKLLRNIDMNLDHPEPRFSAKEEEEKKKAKDTGTGTDAVINDDRTRNTGKKKRPKQKIDISKISRPDGISNTIKNIQTLNAAKPDIESLKEKGKTIDDFYNSKDGYRGGYLTELNSELKAWKEQLYEEYGTNEAFRQLLDGIGKDIGENLPGHLKVSIKPNSTKSNIISLVQNTQRKKKDTGDSDLQNKKVETSEKEQGERPETGKETPSSKMEQWEEGVLGKIKEFGKRDTSKMKEKQFKYFITNTLAGPIRQEGYGKEFSQEFKDEFEKMISGYGSDITIDWGSINKPDKFITFKKSASPSFKDMLLKRFYDTHKDGYFIG